MPKDLLMSALYAVNSWALIPEARGGPRGDEEFSGAEATSDGLARELERLGAPTEPRKFYLMRGQIVLWFPKEWRIPGYRPN